MSPIEIILGIALIGVGVIAFLAHRDGLTFKQEAAKAETAIRVEFNTVVTDLKTKVAVLEHKTSTPTPPPAPPVPGTS
jgi:hypothetical protein